MQVLWIATLCCSYFLDAVFTVSCALYSYCKNVDTFVCPVCHAIVNHMVKSQQLVPLSVSDIKVNKLINQGSMQKRVGVV